MDLREVSNQSSQRHPWEMARARFFGNLLHDSGVLSKPTEVLDVGAGDGFVSACLAKENHPGCQYLCWDIEYEENVNELLAPTMPEQLRFSRSRPDSTFGLIIALDVLEHVQDDAELLATLVRENLSEDGMVLVSVPAWQILFSRHDKELTHHRRYSPQGLRSILEAAGLEIQLSGGLFHSLLLPRSLTKLRETLIPQAPSAEPLSLAWSYGSLAAKAVYSVLRVDNAVSKWLAQSQHFLPGTSQWALCKRLP